MGRPSSYKPEYANQAEKLSKLGATDQEIADFFEVEVRTVYNWKHAHAEFFQALKAGKEEADDRVERSLYQKAIGYEQEEVKIFMPANAAAPVYAPYRAKIAPDTTAAIFWLKNRRREAWRDMQDHRHEVKRNYDLSSVSNEDLAELERIVQSARPSEDNPSGDVEKIPPRVH